MTRLPWQHTRSRTKSGSEKTHLSNPQEWFSRTTSEPSRQALAELVKAHKRGTSDDSQESQNNRSRSRGTVATSFDWQKDRSRTGSVTEETWSRPPSAQHNREGSIYSSFERSEGATKALLTKGSLLLRRTGSKMSLSSTGSSSTLGQNSTPRSHSSNVSVSNASSRSEDIRHKISVPFDFQHVTHTEQTHFEGLGRIDESDLAHKYENITASQAPNTELKGIEASDIQQLGEIHHNPSSSLTTVTALSVQLPPISSRPLPPPKDSVVTDIDSPQGWPSSTRTSPLSPRFVSKDMLKMTDIGLASTVNSTLLRGAWCRDQVTDVAANVDLDVKPLPQLPVIHAVTTDDDTARAMIAGPLPTPPGPVSPASDIDPFVRIPFHQRQQSSLALPRHMSFYPSAKASMPNLLTANPLSVASKSLARHHSDMALSQQAKDSERACGSRASMSFGAVDTRNWEDAVDEAWAAEDSPNYASWSTNCESDYSPDVDAQSALSTPLMMAQTRPLPLAPTERPSPSNSVESHKLESVLEDEPQTDLTGLGISACPNSGANSGTSHISRSSSVHCLKRRSSLCYGANGILTRSSSQESIILSIASSITGTQRSSNSSVSADDLLSMSRIQECDIPDTVHHSFAEPVTSKVVRPESGCLPPDIFEEMSKLNFTSGNSVTASEDGIPPAPLLSQHKYSKSTPKIIVPERKSSVVACDNPRTNRHRSNTTGTRPRQSARISYSLFPTAPTASLPATVTT